MYILTPNDKMWYRMYSCMYSMDLCVKIDSQEYIIHVNMAAAAYYTSSSVQLSTHELYIYVYIYIYI